LLALLSSGQNISKKGGVTAIISEKANVRTCYFRPLPLSHIFVTHALLASAIISKLPKTNFIGMGHCKQDVKILTN
jgi:hypothetical protein